MKKSISILLLVIILILSLTSCNTGFQEDKLKIVGTVFPHFDLAREIGGVRCDVQMLMSPGNDSHSYSGDSPSDILKISECDLFIYTGGESDGKWAPEVIERISKTQETPRTLTLMSLCPTLCESDEGILESDTGHSHEHELPHEHEHECETEGALDEHVWTSPKNAILIAEGICKTLTELDPDGAKYYRENTDRLSTQLSLLDREFEELSREAECHTLVFADRFPFLYFAEEYGFECFAAFGGCASEGEPTPSTLVKLCEIIEDKGLSSVFYTETSKSLVPDTIVGATGVTKRLLHSCHTVTKRELESSVSYISLMRTNLEVLKEALCNE